MSSNQPTTAAGSTSALSAPPTPAAPYAADQVRPAIRSHTANQSRIPAMPVTPGDRDPEELRVELDALRAELGATVDVLANRLNMPARVQEKTREVTDRAKQTAAQVADQAQQTAQAANERVAQVPVVGPTVSRRPGMAAATAVAVLAIAVVVARLAARRSR